MLSAADHLVSDESAMVACFSMADACEVKNSSTEIISVPNVVFMFLDVVTDGRTRTPL